MRGLFAVGRNIPGEAPHRTWQVIRRLTPTQRHVLVLRFYLDLRLVDVADVLDLPLGTVKSNLHRGIAALRQEVP